MATSAKQNPLEDKDPTLTKEELNARREEITAFYKENIPHLEVQAEYEMLLATIEKSRAERMQAQMFMAQQYASQEEGGSPDSEEAKAFKQAMEKKGDSGRDVQTLQTALKISADGQFGPLTEKAVVRFQLSNNFPVTGIVESPMWVLLLNQPILILDEIDEDTDISEEYFTTNFDQVIHRHFLPKGEYLEGPIKNEYTILQEIIILTEQ